MCTQTYNIRVKRWVESTQKMNIQQKGSGLQSREVSKLTRTPDSSDLQKDESDSLDHHSFESDSESIKIYIKFTPATNLGNQLLIFKHIDYKFFSYCKIFYYLNYFHV